MASQPIAANVLLGGIGKRPTTTRPPLLAAPKQTAALCPPGGIPLLAKPEDAPVITRKEKDEILMETAKREAELPSLTIEKSRIRIFSWEEMQKLAGPIRVTNLNLQGNGSVNDPRMGVVNPNVACAYCSQIDCAGHFGLIEFRASIYNPYTIRLLVAILGSVCNDCGCLLMTEDVIKQQGFHRLPADKRVTAIEAYCKDLVCLRKKPQIGGGAVIPCAKNPVFVTTDIKDRGEVTYKIPAKGAARPGKDDPTYPMPIETVSSILNRISDADAKLLGFGAGNHPRNMIMKGCLVPPVIARPPIYEGGSIHHDQLTHMYILIMRKVQDIAAGKQGAVNELYIAIKQLIFKTEGKKMGMRDFLALLERLQGKDKLMRGVAMGKRNNYCGRTVAGPDPSLRYGQIRIPKAWQNILTKPIKVTSFNMGYLTKLLEEGKITHITPKKTGLRKYYDKNYKYTLRIGDSVERWLQNGDRIIVNRQPTLHKQSMMGYEVVLGNQLTIGLHLSYTTPMNCDFDGDENNAWDPQDFQVEAEVETIMNVKNNISSAEQNKPAMGLVMNSVSGAYLLTNSKTVVNDDLFAELISLITNQNDVATLQSRLKKYGINPRSGYAVFSALLPSDFNYKHKGVLIQEGVMLLGRLTKSHVGPSSRSIIEKLKKKYGPQRAADFFTDAPWVINKWMVERGFSVGLMDVVNFAIDPVTGEEYDRNQTVLKQKLAEMYVSLEALGGKADDPMEEENRQRQISTIVNNAQAIGITLAKEVLVGDNAIATMTDQGAGTKGNAANTGQIMGAVAQQNYHGKRLQPTLSRGRRLLPTFDLDDESPEANAFIKSSFSSGLSPEELFFLQAGGREGLLDTALKTAETGTMQHRLIKALESLVIGEDGSVRNTGSGMFAPYYNAGCDPAEMVMVSTAGKPDMPSFIDLDSVITDINIKRGWVPEDVNKTIKENQKQQFVVDNILPKQEAPPVLNEKVIPVNTNEAPVEVVRHRKLSLFEKARIIGIRAMQLSNDAPPLIDIGDEIDFVRIATKEYEAGILPLSIVRKYPDGTSEIVKPTLDNI